MQVTFEQLRRYAVARTLFRPTTLNKAIHRLGFVQADPIRAPARAQDLTLRHRVADYRAGELERRYPRLAIEEDFFVNYGFLPRASSELMHPRIARVAWDAARRRQAQALLRYVHERGSAHPREVDAHFAHGKVANWFGGSSSATTRLLDEMHYRGWLRVVRRDGGTRVYAPRVAALAPAQDEATVGARLDALVDILVHKYAPMPASGLGHLLSLLCQGVPQWRTQRTAAQARARQRLGRVRLGREDWYWPATEDPGSRRWRSDERVRLLTPFDPIVHDRRRFEAFWGWAYRFEAYTPAAKRKLGYYALPVLWSDQVIGWANLAVAQGRLQGSFGYPTGVAPRDPVYRRELAAELDRMRIFLGLSGD